MTNLTMVRPKAKNYARAKECAAHFKIAESTLWNWVSKREGFPQPKRAGPKVTLFDIDAIEEYLEALA